MKLDELADQFAGEALEFTEFDLLPKPARLFQFSDEFQSPTGDYVRFIRTADDQALLVGVGSGGDTIVITAPPSVLDSASKGFWGSLWGAIKGAASAIGGLFTRTTCTTTTRTRTTIDGNNNVISIETTTTTVCN